MKRIVAGLAPLLLVCFTGCGGDDDPPPPLAMNPMTTPEIRCADIRLDDALNKCKSGFTDLLPLLLAGGNNGGGDDKTLMLLMAMMQDQNRPAPPRPPVLPGQPPACVAPQVDKNTSCNDDLITALLLWKSAQKKDSSLAINDEFYRRYLFLKIKDFLNKSAQQMRLQEAQAAILREKLKQAIAAGLFNQGTLSPAELALLQRYVPIRPAPAPVPTYNFGRAPAPRPVPTDLVYSSGTAGSIRPTSPNTTITYSDWNGRAVASTDDNLSMGITPSIPREAMGYGLPSSAAKNAASQGPTPAPAKSALTVKRVAD